MAAESFMHLGMRVTLKPTRNGHYRIEYYQTQLHLQWDEAAKHKGKAAARREAQETAKRYYDDLPELLAKQEARRVRDLEQKVNALPDGVLVALRTAYGLPDADNVTRQVCRLWEETTQALCSALHTMENPAFPPESIRQAVDDVIRSTGFTADRIYTWERGHVQSAVHRVLMGALTLKYSA